MPISMHQASVPAFVQGLNALSAILDKAAAYAEGRKIDPAALLTARLYPDMFNFTRQVFAATQQSVNPCALLAGLAPPALPDAAASFADLKARIAKAVEFMQGIAPEQIDGSEEKEIKLPFGTFKGQLFLLRLALPNFYFHCATAYDILRHNGLEIGKTDFIGRP